MFTVCLDSLATDLLHFTFTVLYSRMECHIYTKIGPGMKFNHYTIIYNGAFTGTSKEQLCVVNKQRLFF